MDKNAIKKYAVWARRELIEKVSQRAMIYGITAKDIGNPDAESVNGHLLSQAEKRQRQALIRNIRAKGFEQVMEEVAYTWFNRFAALRFMEVNGYLPSHVRVFTNDAGEFKPQILAEAIHLELDGLDMNRVYELESANKSEELFKYLLIVQCNALNSILPGMFQRIDDYTELLLPDNLLREGSVAHRLVSDIPEKDFNMNSTEGQVEIIGWLYQYYISEKHDSVINISNKGAVKKEDLPAATQLFTTDWVVRYLIDNSVGRYWIERNPNSRLAEKLTYFVKSKGNNPVYETIAPQELTTFDPCVGSGHFLVYAFDVLMLIYQEYGYSEREAASEIVKNNLFGLDIDGRAVQLAYFAVMMKARQHDRRFFTRGIQPHIYEIIESNSVDKDSVEAFCGNDDVIKKDIELVLEVLRDAKEYGSIIQMPFIDFTRIKDRFFQLESEITLYSGYLLGDFRSLIYAAEIMSTKYAVVATNPPYHNKYDAKLRDYLFANYNDYKGDLFSVFIYHNFEFCKENGYSAFMAPFVWMFIKTYEKLRDFIVDNKAITTLVQMEYSAFEEATVPICSFVLKNGRMHTGAYFRLSDFKGGMAIQREKVLEAIENKECGYFYEADQSDFNKIPGTPIAYWLSQKWFHLFENSVKIAEVAKPRVGQNTGDNERFLRLWHEIEFGKIGFGVGHNDLPTSPYKWIPYSKGGAFRRWYGNYYYVINWENDGKEIKDYAVIRNKGKHWSRYIQNLDYMCCEGVTWSDISSSKFACRYLPEGFICDVKGSSAYPSQEVLLPYLAFLNSNITYEGLKVLAPTISFQTGDIGRLPFCLGPNDYALFEELTRMQIALSKEDWDSVETSWDFTIHPLLRGKSMIKDAFVEWERECYNRFLTLKANEEKLNSMFIELYELQGEVSPAVDDSDVTVSLANEKQAIRSLISYAVGCMFGRYSIDRPGVVFAGGQWDTSAYIRFKPDSDGIIPICDDEYFEDDIVGRFIEFIKVAFGTDTLEENLSYISGILGGKGSSREVLRNYFINEFYTDHCNTYSVTGSGKRPIYWLFDSGKKNGFKCLIYMHRYQPDTIARIRTDYVHEQQSRYRTAIADLEQRINGASTSERVKLSKQLATLQAQAEEIRVYEEKIHHLADQMIKIDLDDGVKHNYEIFKDVLAKIK